MKKGSLEEQFTNEDATEVGLQLLFGSIPTSIGEISNLKYLHLERNSLTGQIPSSSSNLIELRKLDLSFNYLTTSSLFDPKKMTALYIGNNWLSRNKSAAISPRSPFSVLSRQPCSLTGEITLWLSGQKKLKELDLRSSQEVFLLELLT
ncbi:hypothetical protein HPP92_013036 [Vanilla planifolia]|uniref:Uncharacterized protein n=1 Tax=Vanilla planifolia TaxID=51239 RepID=A0A835R2S5_VANPL|nr:hypothetical protein HPP92_013036 [Vanilla planifolia]